MCGLQDYAEASVGSLNIEHRKRTTIAVELAAKVGCNKILATSTERPFSQPKLLLFLDEPTSGLDSQSAWAIMTFLRSLADNGQAILCTWVHSMSPFYPYSQCRFCDQIESIRYAVLTSLFTRRFSLSTHGFAHQPSAELFQVCHPWVNLDAFQV